jgi:hypothetical protein
VRPATSLLRPRRGFPATGLVDAATNAVVQFFLTINVTLYSCEQSRTDGRSTYLSLIASYLPVSELASFSSHEIRVIWKVISCPLKAN